MIELQEIVAIALFGVKRSQACASMASMIFCASRRVFSSRSSRSTSFCRRSWFASVTFVNSSLSSFLNACISCSSLSNFEKSCPVMHMEGESYGRCEMRTTGSPINGELCIRSSRDINESSDSIVSGVIARCNYRRADQACL